MRFSLPKETYDHYQSGIEEERLLQGVGQLEFCRTQEIIQRYLPAPPAVILDVGGGSGIYSLWLAKHGYESHLIDATPLHVEQARHASMKQSEFPIASIEIGDARNLNHKDSTVDAVLLLGPLYHLTERKERLIAFREAKRVLRKNGIIFTVCISRFASILDGLFRGLMKDTEFVKIAQQDLKNGQHRNPNNHPDYFTTAFLHKPDEIKDEIRESGLQLEKLLAIEGPGWLLQNFDEHWNDKKRQQQLLETIKHLEEEESILGISAHIMAVAKKIS